jgi:hypothetical protein
MNGILFLPRVTEADGEGTERRGCARHAWSALEPEHDSQKSGSRHRHPLLDLMPRDRQLVGAGTMVASETGDLLVPFKLVAGACNQRYLQLWSGAA